MREIRLSGLEGGGAVIRSPYPYPRRIQWCDEVDSHLRSFPKVRRRCPSAPSPQITVPFGPVLPHVAR